MIFSYWL